jgi:hypothetical protein
VRVAAVASANPTRFTRLGSALTDSSGRYEIAGLAPGTFDVLVERFDNQTQTTPEIRSVLLSTATQARSLGNTGLLERSAAGAFRVNQPFALGETFFAQQFDRGGQDIAYNDFTPTNLGNFTGRSSEAVDLGLANDGVNAVLGFTQPGEWVGYTVNIDRPTTDLVLQARVANVAAGARFGIQLFPVGNTTPAFTRSGIVVPNTGSFTSYTTVTTNLTGLNLAPGNYQLRINLEQAGGSSVGNYESFTLYRPGELPVLTAPTITDIRRDGNRIIVSWTDPNTREFGYRVERRVTGTTDFTDLGTYSANTTTGFETLFSPGPSLDNEYRIVAIRGPLTAASSIRRFTSTTAPVLAPVTNLAATAFADRSVLVTWTDNSSAESFYYVRRRQVGATPTPFVTIADLPANTTNFADSARLPGVTYEYTVLSANADNTQFSSGNPVVSVTIPGSPVTAPAAPSELNGTFDGSAVNLVWRDNSTNENTFRIERRFDGETAWTVLTGVPANTTTFRDATAISNVVYNYRVLAVNDAAAVPSASVNVSTDSIPQPVAGSISGFVWTDSNFSTTFDTGEPRGAGQVVFIDTNNNGSLDTSEPRVGTDAAGNYRFSSLAAGTYNVRLLVASGFYQSFPLNNSPAIITLAAGGSRTGVNFGTMMIPGVASIASRSATSTVNRQLYIDLNRNGRFDAGENTVRSRSIFLDTNNNGRRDASELNFVLDPQGRFTFSGSTVPDWRKVRVV